jgi:hypothetical protein
MRERPTRCSCAKPGIPLFSPATGAVVAVMGGTPRGVEGQVIGGLAGVRRVQLLTGEVPG